MLTPPGKKSCVIIKEQILTDEEWREKIQEKERIREEKEKNREEKERIRKEKASIREEKEAKKQSKLPSKQNKLNDITNLNQPISSTISSPVLSPLSPLGTNTNIIIESPSPVKKEPIKIKFNFSSRSGRSIKRNRKYVVSSSLSSSSSDESINEDDICALCNRETPKHHSKSLVQWIRCDICDKWFRTICEIKRKSANFIVDNGLYHCSFCE